MMTFGSLFAGIGGIDEGLERAGMACQWQVEIDHFCRKVLSKHWPKVPKYGDIKQIAGNELARVDLICGGYPCQPFSQAGKRGGTNDARHLWPEVARLLCILRPRYVLLENVPGHLSLGFGDVLGDLARLGFDAEWFCLRASAFGAAHLRKRVFVVAYRADRGWRELREPSGRDRLTLGCDEELANSARNARHRPHRKAGDKLANTGCWEGRPKERQIGWRPSDHNRPASGELANTTGERRKNGDGRKTKTGTEAALDGLSFAPGPTDSRWSAILAERPDLAPAIESPVRGMGNGLPTGMDGALQDRTKRLRALGNSVVPQCAEWIGRRMLAHEQYQNQL